MQQRQALTTLWWDPTKGNLTLPLALTMAVFYSDELSVIYPVIPWLAVMMLGWVFGRYPIRIRVQPARLLAVVGTALLLVFLAVRGLNGYGNMLLDPIFQLLCASLQITHDPQLINELVQNTGDYRYMPGIITVLIGNCAALPIEHHFNSAGSFTTPVRVAVFQRPDLVVL